jgi:hypothetical protein
MNDQNYPADYPTKFPAELVTAVRLAFQALETEYGLAFTRAIGIRPFDWKCALLDWMFKGHKVEDLMDALDRLMKNPTPPSMRVIKMEVEGIEKERRRAVEARNQAEQYRSRTKAQDEQMWASYMANAKPRGAGRLPMVIEDPDGYAAMMRQHNAMVRRHSFDAQQRAMSTNSADRSSHDYWFQPGKVA